MDRSRVEAAVDEEVHDWIWDQLFIIAKGINREASYLSEVLHLNNGFQCFIHYEDGGAYDVLLGIPIDALYDPEAYIEEYLSEEH